MPDAVWHAGPGVVFAACARATFNAANGGAAWFRKPNGERAMLPHASTGGVYRCILFCDISARYSTGVYCGLEDEVSV